MRIRFLTSISGMTYTHKRGDVVDWPDAKEALRFIKAEIAEPVNTAGRTEKAVDDRRETRGGGGKGNGASVGGAKGN